MRILILILLTVAFWREVLGMLLVLALVGALVARYEKPSHLPRRKGGRR